MAASSLFGSGVGVKKLELLLEEIPNLLVIKKTDLMDKILSVKGFSEKTAKKIIDNLPSFTVFMTQIQTYITFKVEKIKDKINLRVVFTGFRNKGLEDEIKEKGGEVLSGVSGKTTHLVVKDKNEKTTKIDKAKKLNIPILTEDEFVEILKKF
jgi:NAD-dependent DNA ligase